MEEQNKPEDSGRGTDSVMAHISLGEIVIPRAVQDDPEVQQMLDAIFQKAGADIGEFTVGDEANKINPETGYPEFGFFKKIFSNPIVRVAAPVALSLLAPGLGTAIGSSLLGAGAVGASTLGSGILGAGIGALTGGGLKGALTGAVTGGLAPNLSGIGSSINNATSGALSDFGDATGLSSLYNSASGGLSDAVGGIKDQIGSAYNGSTLQDAFKSGGDVLKAAGLNTTPDSLSTGVGASSGGGISSYSPTEDFNSYKLPSLGTSNSNIFANAGNPSASSALSPLTGATNVASSSNYASPIASALLGTYTNNKAQDQLLKQQNANSALLAPYQNFKFNPGDLTQDPGYQFNLAQGNQALDRQQLAKGGYFSGNALKEAQTFGQGLADNTYNTAFNRALQTNNAGLQGAAAQAGVNDNIGNINAGSTVNTGNLYSGALGNILGGNSFTNSGALQGGSNDILRQLLLKQQLGLVA